MTATVIDLAGRPDAPTAEWFDHVRSRIVDAGYGQDIDWAESLGVPPRSAEDFAAETIYVICNSGMKHTVARGIYERVRKALVSGKSARSAFRHPGKAAAIDTIWNNRQQLLDDYNAADDKVAFCAGLPWIGDITKWHLAKNFGADVAKPDIHLQRLADRFGTDPQSLCEHLAGLTGLRVATVDTVLWRACAIGALDGRTARLMAPPAREPDTDLFTTCGGGDAG